MHILVSPNSFKNSLDAQAVAEAIETGLLQSGLACTITCLPVGDGGDGTGDLLTQLCHGSIITTSVVDPIGREINAVFGLIDDGKTAVIEMAAASGHRLLRSDEMNPLHTSSYGTGLQIRCALEKGVTKIILCVGGSATIDGGCGILQALGIRFLDDNGKDIHDIPAGLCRLASIDMNNLDKRMEPCELVVLCDVKNILLGNKGAASVFGPQKGATEESIPALENCLLTFSRVVQKVTGKDMTAVESGGAAGGTAAGLYGVLGAKLVSGIDHFLDTTGFDQQLEKANIVITGEGCIDRQTLEGKAPYGVALRAAKNHIPVIALAGKIPLSDQEELNRYFNVLLPISNEPADIKTALASTRSNLISTAMQLGKLLSIK